MLIGKQTWNFINKPVIISTGVVGGPFEAESPLAEDFDYINKDIRLGEIPLKRLKKNWLIKLVTSP